MKKGVRVPELVLWNFHSVPSTRRDEVKLSEVTGGGEFLDFFRPHPCKDNDEE